MIGLLWENSDTTNIIPLGMFSCIKEIEMSIDESNRFHDGLVGHFFVQLRNQFRAWK